MNGKRFAELEEKYQNSGVNGEIISDEELIELKNYYSFMLEYLDCKKNNFISMYFILAKNSVENTIFYRNT